MFHLLTSGHKGIEQIAPLHPELQLQTLSRTQIPFPLQLFGQVVFNWILQLEYPGPLFLMKKK